MPLIEITVACGFSSISYFSHSFHHQYHMSPTRYRETFAGR
ncbi:MAG: helix-turn-helix domain-containing protein [Phycisphaeraceae bacterium]